MKRHGRWSVDDTGRIIEHRDAAVPTTTVLMSRLPIFQPTQRPVRRRGEWFAAAWGRARVTGRLGQRHADLVECLLHDSEATMLPTGGGIEILVDPAVIRRRLGQPKSQYSGEQLDVLLDDLLTSLVEIESTSGVRARGSMLDHVIQSPAVDADNAPVAPAGWFASTPRAWMCVRLGSVVCTLLTHDLCLLRPPVPFLAVPHGITQAVARLVATHRDEPTGGWLIDTLIRAVAGVDTMPTATLRNRRREIKSDAIHLEALGLAIADGRLRRVG